MKLSCKTARGLAKLEILYWRRLLAAVVVNEGLWNEEVRGARMFEAEG